MKKFLALLTVVFLSQLLLSNARNFSFIGVEFVLAKQVEANIEFIPAGGEIVTKKANILTENVYPLTQETHESIQCNNVTNVLKHSIEESTASQLGSPFWAKTFGGRNHDEAYSIQQTSDGGYIVAGFTGSFGAGSDDLLIIKLDSEGNLSWAKTFGGRNHDEAYSIQQTSDGGYIVAGFTGSFGAGSDDLLIIKLDSEGNLSWAKTFGGQ